MNNLTHDNVESLKLLETESHIMTEEEVTTFLQSFPEFKNCRFEVEIVQANDNDLSKHEDPYAYYRNQPTGSYDMEEHQRQLIPSEFQEQYVRVDNNSPFNHLSMPQNLYNYQEQFTDNVNYLNSPEDEMRNMIWKYDMNTKQQPSETEQQSTHSEHQENPLLLKSPSMSDFQNQKTENVNTYIPESAIGVKHQTPNVYKIPPMLEIPRTPLSIQTSASSSHTNNRNSYEADKNNLISTSSLNDSHASIVTNTNAQNTKSHPENNIKVMTSISSVGELAKKFSKSTSLYEGDKERSTTTNPSSKLENKSPERLKPYPRKSRNTQSATSPVRKHHRNASIHETVNIPRVNQDSERKRHHTRATISKHCSINTKKYSQSPVVSKVGGHKYCYIDGEKFKIVDYAKSKKKNKRQHNHYTDPMFASSHIQSFPNQFQNTYMPSQSHRGYISNQQPSYFSKNASHRGQSLSKLSRHPSNMYSSAQYQDNIPDWNRLGSIPSCSKGYNTVPNYFNYSIWP